MGYVSPAEARRVQERKARVHALNVAAEAERRAKARRQGLAVLVAATIRPAKPAGPKRDARGRFVKASS